MKAAINKQQTNPQLRHVTPHLRNRGLSERVAAADASGIISFLFFFLPENACAFEALLVKG